MMPEPQVELYDDQQYRASHAASERRLAAARARARKARRWKALGIGLLILAVPVGLAAAVALARAPQAPYLVVTWPKPKVPQVLAPGQTVLARGGQPFEIALTNVERWDVTWKSGSAEQTGGQFSWAPAEGTGHLRAECRPLAQDWERYFQWLWPTRHVGLTSVAAVAKSNYARQISTNRDGVWVYPHIFAAGSVAWDERALPLLADAAELLPASNADQPSRAEPGAGNWRLVSDFEGEAGAPNLDATFASLHAPDIESALPKIAARIVKRAPDASVKFVLRLDRDPQQAIVRIAYDGKRERAAWVRRTGDAKGHPLTGWEKATK